MKMNRTDGVMIFHARSELLGTLLKRFETTGELAAALFLCSKAGAAITGQNLNVNCGLATY
jgi:enoyl-[acyl-carrier-protein] reductase (NADH)